MRRHIKKVSLTILKLAFAFAALGFVLYKSDVASIEANILNSNPVYLLAAFTSLNLATFLGSLRLKTYFAAESMKLPESYALIIYYIGLFFNTVLPGGIGGDGYITIHLRRKFAFPALRVVRILLATRANGLFFLNLVFFAFAMLSDFGSKIPYLKPIIIGLFILQMPVYTLAARYILKEKISTFLKAGALSFISQIFSLLTAYFVFRAIGISDNYINYLTLYMAAAIVAVLPVTPGGVGLRELIFFQGSHLIGLNPQLAVSGSLVYFAVYLATSLPGLALYLFGNKLGIHHKEQNHGTDANPAG